MTSSKDLIVAAACKILNEFGLDAVTIRNVADTSNYGRSTVTHHFGDKDSLLDALHLIAIDTFAVHITKARFSSAFAPDDIEAQAELMNRLGVELDETSLTEAATQIYLRFRATYPGYWKLLRFRQCPDFSEAEAPVAFRMVTAFCGNPLEGPIGLTVDVIVHQLFSLHEWAAVANPAALLRIMHNEPSLNYWLSAFGHLQTPGTTS